MYLHLGKNVVVAYSEIVAVCDLDNSSHSHITRAYLTTAEKSGQVVNVCDDLPKSFVVCQKKDGSRTLYLSQLASSTLLKRANTLSFE
ncbi:MAG: DUF370 domain-containing protein [Firmicutes bacterium HGW-Firmicutes-16]|nr:MAG: DUF370 domain-containing protein [Firmicutes bacterium HGW-Firmicutes-16]